MISSPTHPVHGILPPHILESILRHGDETQRKAAMQTLTESARFQGRRELLGEQVLAASAPVSTPPVRAKQRVVYSDKNTTKLPGTKVRSEGDPASNDIEVNEAYDGAGATYDFYASVFQRSSVDGKGMPLNSTVHYGSKYDNAFWNGQQMVYGDGDVTLFNRFTICLDVIGHELTHGVTQYTAGLTYQGQSGALNESISDVFGSMVKQYHLKQAAADADWLIGAGLLAPKVKGVALRSMKEPGTAYNDPILGKDPQPADMSGYLQTTSDSGGVHLNSGIPNHAFYLAAVALGGHSWEKAGPIWYQTLLQLHADADFKTMAALTKTVAGKLYGPTEVKAVAAAWAGVGLPV